MHLWQTGREQQERWRAAMTGFSVFASIESNSEEQMQHAGVEDMVKNSTVGKNVYRDSDNGTDTRKNTDIGWNNNFDYLPAMMSMSTRSAGLDTVLGRILEYFGYGRVTEGDGMACSGGENSLSRFIGSGDGHRSSRAATGEIE